MCTALGSKEQIMAKQAKKVRVFSALEVANICGVVNQTAINWIKNGHLRAFTTPGGQYRIYAEDLLDFLRSRDMRVPSEVEEIAQREKKQILVVDDDAEVNNLIKTLFEKRLGDFEVLQAFDGFEAGRILAENRPVLIVLDMALPGVDGHKLISTIREDRSFENPRIIATSGITGEVKNRERIINEGADVFMEKPVDNDALVETAQKLLQQGLVRGR